MNTTGVNAIAGLSISGTTVLQLPIAKSGLYRAVAAYSECAQIRDRIKYEFVEPAVQACGGDVDIMHGHPAVRCGPPTTRMCAPIGCGVWTVRLHRHGCARYVRHVQRHPYAAESGITPDHRGSRAQRGSDRGTNARYAWPHCAGRASTGANRSDRSVNHGRGR
ncbi:hypothetical protein [Nocardia brevicatena]|uniref:hypothetical protein n=1 Tax=Nocardia brevicatena TaxID=37327 RepID=UPI0034D5DD53